MNLNDDYYFVIKGTSTNSCGGSRYSVTILTGRDIVAAAEDELINSGDRLENLAGISFYEDDDGIFHPERELSDDEKFQLSSDVLNDDGRLFWPFITTKTSALEFVNEAKEYGLENEAKALYDSWDSRGLLD